MYILKLNHGFALLKAVQTNHTQYRIDKYTCCIYSRILRCLDNCEIKQNTACRTNELHIVYIHETCPFSFSGQPWHNSCHTIFICQFDELVGGG